MHGEHMILNEEYVFMKNDKTPELGKQEQCTISFYFAACKLFSQSIVLW